MSLDYSDNCQLEILIATFSEKGLKRLAEMSLPESEGVRYLVACQCPGHDSLPIPAQLRRSDLRVIFSPDKGISKNRNFALLHASAPLCLLSDDDVSFTPDAFSNIITTFRNNPDIDIATFMFLNSHGTPAKHYPSSTFTLSKPVKGYYVSSIEIAFRREKIVDSGILFNENFGTGASRFGCCEEGLWIHDLLNFGFKGAFFPFVIATHNDDAPTGVRLMATPDVLRANGAYITRVYPYSALLRVVLKAWRVARGSEKSFFKCLAPTLGGWWLASFRKKELFGSGKIKQKIR